VRKYSKLSCKKINCAERSLFLGNLRDLLEDTEGWVQGNAADSAHHWDVSIWWARTLVDQAEALTLALAEDSWDLKAVLAAVKTKSADVSITGLQANW
jgi:hypothetical protein